MPWNFVTREYDTAAFLRDDPDPTTAPRYENLDERSQKQVTAANKVIRGLIKAGMVGEGKVAISASGHAHHDPVRMPTDPSSADFIAVSIGRVK